MLIEKPSLRKMTNFRDEGVAIGDACERRGKEATDHAQAAS
jgi:hypothetical protein